MAQVKEESAVQRFFCQCVMNDDSEVFLSVKATTEAEASRKVHAGYTVAYVLDILTVHQMERRKRPLRPSLYSSKALH